MVIENEGSSSLRKTPRVELMIPAPIRTTSGSVLMLPSPSIYGKARLDSRSCLVWLVGGRGTKRHRRAGLEHDVGAAPGRVVGQSPAVPGTGGILRKQDVARPEHEVLAFAGLEIQRSAQGDDELAHRRIVPGERATGCRLLEGDARHADLLGQPVAPRARGEIDHAFLEMRVTVFPGP